MKRCRRCGLKTVLSDADIKKAVDETRAMRGIKTVTEDIYSLRLAACMDCDKLEYGSTCMLCGCIVQVRALLKDGRCPYPGKPRWTRQQ